LEGTLKIIWFQPPCHLSLDQVAQNPIQPGLEHFQGGGIHSFSGQPVPVPYQPHSEESVERSSLLEIQGGELKHLWSWKKAGEYNPGHEETSYFCGTLPEALKTFTPSQNSSKSCLGG